MVALTLAEAAEVLEPALTEKQLRAIVHALGWQPSGTRLTGRQGRPVATYDATEILKLHAVLLPYLHIPGA